MTSFSILFPSEFIEHAGENYAEFSFAAAVRGYYVYWRVWLPHLRQRLKAGRELGNAEDCFAIAVYSLREHSDHTARADDNLSKVFTAKDNSDSWLFGFSIFHSIYTRTSHQLNLFTFYLTPNGHINNYFWPFG